MSQLVLLVSLFFGPYATIIAGILAKEDYLRPAIILALIYWFSIFLFGFGYLWAIYTCFKIY
jgi:hypothetical protein